MSDQKRQRLLYYLGSKCQSDQAKEVTTQHKQGVNLAAVISDCFTEKTRMASVQKNVAPQREEALSIAVASIGKKKM